MTLDQLRLYRIAEGNIAAGNLAFMDMVNCESNPMTREDLETLLAKHPQRYARFAGYLRTLPTRAQVAAPGFNLKEYWARQNAPK